ncbi:MAG TPA: dTDP-4-dehydrorhamnose 3,5-epimerase [Caulobacteraceae bacterium]|jgi:dTDP-4-dehydrorhamnose 3,5-epimerase|nr:dTDP-4-dehydrorhamnose 3,5-epimerase [Caulobacteraceae bacterium]
MKFLATPLAGAMIVEPHVFGDDRGFFMETWHREKFAAAGIDVTFDQDNHSRSAKGVLRGLHYQLPNPQGKLARVALGTVFDVIVDLRRASPTFGRWFGVELSAENRRMLWVPQGFAHGFLVVSEFADFLYKCSGLYSPADEKAVRWDDRTLAIDWPLEGAPSLSAKDAAAPLLADAVLFP